MSAISYRGLRSRALTPWRAFWIVLAFAGCALLNTGGAFAAPAATVAAEGYKAVGTTAESGAPLLTPVWGHHHHHHHYYGGGGFYWGGPYYYGPYYYGPDYYDYQPHYRYHYYRPYYYGRINRAYRRCRHEHGPEFCKRHWRRYR